MSATPSTTPDNARPGSQPDGRPRRFRLPGQRRTSTSTPSATPTNPTPASAQNPRTPNRTPKLSWLTATKTKLNPILDHLKTKLRKAFTVTTPLLWLTATITATASFLAYTYGWLEFGIIATSGGILIAIAALFMIGRNPHSAHLELTTPRVTAGDRAYGVLRAHNKTSRPHSGRLLEMTVGKGIATFKIPALKAEADHTESFVLPTTRRQVIPVGPVRAVRGDALGLFRREQIIATQQHLYVHPKTVHLPERAVGFLRDVEGITTETISNSDVSFHALREYTAGDDRRSIHWRTTARTGTLMVRQFEETRRAHLVVALSTNGADYASEHEFETAVSSAGSLILNALHHERQVSLMTHKGLIPAHGGLALMDYLSSITLEQDTHTIDHLIGQVNTHVSSASVVALLAGSAPPVQDLTRSQLRAPVNAKMFIVRCVAANQKPACKRLAKSYVVEIPTLDKLPAAVGSLR